LVVIEWLTRREQHPLAALSNFPRPVRWAVYMIFVWLTVLMGTISAGQFIYFQF
jgi:hypothetical protein